MCPLLLENAVQQYWTVFLRKKIEVSIKGSISVYSIRMIIRVPKGYESCFKCGVITDTGVSVKPSHKNPGSQVMPMAYEYRND